MPFHLGHHSLDNLIGVHPKLADIVKLAITLSTRDFRVIEGVRSDEQAFINYGKGRSAEELRAKGVPDKYARPDEPQVTWVSNPLATKHRKQPDGFSHAVDLVPLDAEGNLDWENTAGYDAIYKAMMAAASELGVTLRSGIDWDMDGNLREKRETDSPHYEIVGV